MTNKWNETDEYGRIVIPYQFHSTYPRDYRKYVVDTVNAMQTILGNTCLHFADVTGQNHRFKNYIEITCEHPESGKYSQESFGNDMAYL